MASESWGCSRKRDRYEVTLFPADGTDCASVEKSYAYLNRGKLPDKEIKRYEEAKKLRAKYRNLLSQVKKQYDLCLEVLRRFHEHNLSGWRVNQRAA